MVAMFRNRTISDHEHIEIQQVQPVEDLRVGTHGGGGDQALLRFRFAQQEVHPDLVREVVDPHIGAVGRVYGHFQGGSLVRVPAVQALDVREIRVDDQVVVHLQDVAVHGGHVELAHANLFPDEIGGHVISFLEARDGRKARGNGHAQAGVRTVG